MRNPQREVRLGRALAAALLLAWAHAAGGQTFSSGSTGADGPLNLPFGGDIVVRPGGVYHHTTVNLGSGTLRYLKGADNSPVVILATGDVIISGTISLDGGSVTNPGGGITPPGGVGGPGGFNGGIGSFSSGTNTTLAGPGQGPGGGAANTATSGAAGGSYGAPTSFVLLTPLFGGSGGGGGDTGGGGGGGGAILIASSTRIFLDTFGLVRANGGTGGVNFGGGSCPPQPASGSGGAIRLVAPTISGPGRLEALRGALFTTCGQIQPTDGRIRVEAFNLSAFTGTANPAASVANAPGAVSPAGNPALANVPTLQIASIGGLTVPTVPVGSYAAPDLALAAGTPNPIPIVINATNTPVGPPTVITVRLMPRGVASSVAVSGLNHTGSFASSTATANVNLALGVTIIQASAAMTLTGQTASLFPLIDGEPVERVMVATAPGESSTLSLVTRSGKERRLDELPLEDQVRVARAWEAMRETRTE